MATKVFEFDFWATKDNDGEFFIHVEEPQKKEKEYWASIYLAEIQDELNIKNINEPYEFKIKVTFEDLSNNPESDSINNQKQEIMPENSQTPLEQAKAAVHFHSDCKLLTKEEYEELCKYKSLYLDLKGSINNIMNQFKDK